jgi:RES domain-containing protein
LITVYRIGYCEDPKQSPQSLLASLGFGSTLAHGRWHTMGPRQVVYCGSTRALCQLEKRVHANGFGLKNQTLLRLELPDHSIAHDVENIGLPEDWKTNEAATRALGDTWLASRVALGLWVPSYVEPSERNMLLNPAHPDYQRIVVTVERHPFEFDPRLF